MAEAPARRAVFDASGRYRYRLTRTWPEAGSLRLLFVMLNPSTGDAHRDDPTIRRCMGFARAWGCGILEVVNLFSWRATRPAHRGRPRRAGKRPTSARGGRDRTDLVVCALGGWAGSRARAAAVLNLLRQTTPGPLWCLGVTRGGQPRHPLHVPAVQELMPWA